METIPNKDLPHIAYHEPAGITVEPGKVYSWCSCGLTAKTPFCDGSHVSTSFSPILKDLDNSWVVLEAAINLWLSEDELITGTGISISEGSELLFGQSNKLFLISRGNVIEFLNSFVDSLDDVGKNGIFLIGHLSLSKALKSKLEVFRLNFILIVFVGNVNTLKSLTHHVTDDLVLVDGLESFGLLKDELSTCIQMIFKCDLVGDEVLNRRWPTLRRALLRTPR